MKQLSIVVNINLLTIMTSVSKLLYESNSSIYIEDGYQIELMYSSPVLFPFASFIIIVNAETDILLFSCDDLFSVIYEYV